MDEEKIIRKCCACNEKKSRNELIKITLNSKTKELKVSPSSTFFGRSVYICANQDCVEKAFKKGRINKLLKTKTDENFKMLVNEAVLKY